MRRATVAALAGVLGFGALTWARSPSPPEPEPAPTHASPRMVAEIAASVSSLEPEAVEALASREPVDPDVDVASVLAASAPTEAEQRAYFDENREIFGTRTYERSEDRIRRILTFRKAAEHLRR